MEKLVKAVFSAKNRLREARNKSGVNCSTCTNLLRIEEPREEAFCNHEDRLRRVRLEPKVEDSPFYFGPSSIVCDGYEAPPLPNGVTLPTLLDGQAISLFSQCNIFHADPSCPYVLDELRMKEEGNEKAGFRTVDISNLVRMEIISWDLCEMPCCDSRLPYQNWRIDSYKGKVGIRPDGSEEKVWVRKVVDHERKVNMTIEEAEAFFDLSNFDGKDFRRVHDGISAASDYLRGGSNRLESRPLTEAANPVSLWGVHHFLSEPKKGIDGKLEVLVYDERLFDKRRIPKLSPGELPDGIILCRDTNNVLREARYHVASVHSFSGTYYLIGIVRELDAHQEESRGLTHCLDIRAINYSGANHAWGIFGKGFNHMAFFD